MNLYSCGLGEYSIDEDGGVFTQNLIKSAYNITGNEKLIIDAYSEALKMTQTDTKGKQNPKYRMAKLPPAQQLIISINPKII